MLRVPTTVPALAMAPALAPGRQATWLALRGRDPHARGENLLGAGYAPASSAIKPPG